jgi:hypothetical protein
MEVGYLYYGSIIIRGLCNSPMFLKNHFQREFKTLSDKGYSIEEYAVNIYSV